MALFRCARFPAGTAHIRTDLGVVVLFRDGAAEVSDLDLVAALLRVPAVFGVERVDAEPDLPSDASGDVPDSAIPAVMAWVGDDPDRAARALEVELARGDRARTTLIRALEAMTRDT